MLQFQAHVNRLTFTQQAEGHFTADWHRTHFRTQGGKLLIGLPFREVMTSPALMPAFAAEEFGMTLAYECAALSVHFHRFRQLGVQFGTP
ncbi:hypothetical protein HR12_32230 [Microbacterium sp. SUBG005]|nr:hypothetical protein HR12_32230 [Microbacterium sp. SUBG005]